MEKLVSIIAVIIMGKDYIEDFCNSILNTNIDDLTCEMIIVDIY